MNKAPGKQTNRNSLSDLDFHNVHRTDNIHFKVTKCHWMFVNCYLVYMWNINNRKQCKKNDFKLWACTGNCINRNGVLASEITDNNEGVEIVFDNKETIQAQRVNTTGYSRLQVNTEQSLRDQFDYVRSFNARVKMCE